MRTGSLAQCIAGILAALIDPCNLPIFPSCAVGARPRKGGAVPLCLEARCRSEGPVPHKMRQ